MNKCPICGQNTLGNIPPLDDSTAYFISSVNENTNPVSIDPSSGVPVQLIGCASCGIIFMQSDKLINR